LTPAGKFRYEAAFGRRSLKDADAAEALEKDAVCFVASCKLSFSSIFLCFAEGFEEFETCLRRIRSERPAICLDSFVP